MSTLILFQAPNCLRPDDAFDVQSVDDLDACVTLLRNASPPCAVVIGPTVVEDQKTTAVDAAIAGGAYYLVMSPGDSLARIRRLVRAVLAR